MMNRRNILAAAVALAPTLAAAQTINVDPEGDVAHAAASARNQFNVRGAGIKVCVISYNDNGVDQAKGVYLPSSVDTVGGLHGPSAAAKDGEGAAMLEIVHRLAPDATLAFASGSPTPGADSDPAIEDAFTQLANANCKIIVDDLTNTYEAPFQDGRVAKVVNQVAAKGILVVSSSGNFGNDARQTSQVWEGDFTDSGAVWPGTQDLLHTFQLADGIAGRSNVVYPTDPASNDPLLACPPGQLPSGAYVPTAVAILTWNDPLGSTTDDYGLYVIDSSSSPRFLYQGSTLPTQPNNPLKFASVLPNSVVVITKKPTAQQRHLRLTVVGSCGRLKYATVGQTFGHNAAASVITVGAVSARNRTTPFDNTVSVDGGSSDGPRRMYFAADGTAYTPTDFTKTGGKLLLKPDLVAASGVMTSVTNYKPFAGSSAAAPHVAAIAALVWSYKPALTAAEVRLALVGSAIDIETQGWDETSGYGIPMADRALRVAGTVGDPAFMNQLSRNYTARSLATSQGHYLVLLNNGSVGAFVVGMEMSGNGVVVAPIWQGIPSLPIVEPVAVGFDNDDALVLNKDGSLVRWRPAWPN